MAEKKYVVSMFDSIALTYDRLNHILSLNIDKTWRKKAVRRIAARNPKSVIDIACGTADSTIELARTGIPNIVGIDVSNEMLKIGKEKIESLGLKADIQLKIDDCENLSFHDNSFEAAFIAFGIRNFEDRTKGLHELRRVLKDNGHLMILELSVPENKIQLALYKLYFLNILPLIGKMVSGNNTAYSYLPQSVLNFPKPSEFMDMMRECGFTNVSQKPLTFGLCRMYEGFCK